MMLHVKCSINSVESAPSPLPSEFAAYEARMVAIRDAVEELFGRSAVPYEIVDFCEGWLFPKTSPLGKRLISRTPVMFPME